MQIGGIALYEALQLGQIAVAGGYAGELAGLLHGDDVPLLVANDGLQRGFSAYGSDAAHHLSVDVCGLVVQQVVVVGVNAATANICVADDE